LSLTHTAIHRPVTTAMTFIGIAVLGVMAINQISIDFLPPVQVPELMVQTAYSGSSPEEVEKQISEPIESTLGTVNGVKHLSSISREGLSLVRLGFYWGVNIDYAMLEVREKLDAVRGSLPPGAERPTILRIDPSTESIMTLSITNKNSTTGDPLIKQTELAQLREFGEALVKRRLEQIQGVAQAVVAGGSEREIHVWVDTDKSSSYGLTLQEISAALEHANIHYSGATLKKGVFRYAFRATSELETLRDIGQVTVAGPQGRLIPLSQIADIQEAFAERQGLTRVNGDEAILLFLRKETGANTVALSAEIHKVLAQLASDYPAVDFRVLFNQAEFIKKSIADIEQAIFWGALLAFFVLFLFLRNPRYPLIIGIVTPFSILATIVMMYFSGITFNIISLTGLALGIGMLGDNAIIIVENFSRLREQGKSIREAVLEGSQDLNTTVSAATFTNVAIFLPVIFVRGVTQKLFVDMSLTMTFSLLASLLVAITLVPALLDRFRLGDHLLSSTRVSRTFDLYYASLMKKYLLGLQWCLNHRAKVLLITISATLISGVVAFFIPAEEAPDVDQSRFTIDLTMPKGATLEATAALSLQIEDLLRSLLSVDLVAADVGISSRDDYYALLYADLDRSKIEVRVKPGYSVKQAIAACRTALARIEQQWRAMGATVAFKRRATTFERILQPSEHDIEIKIIGKDLTVAAEIGEHFMRLTRSVPGLSDVQPMLKQNNPQVRLRVDRSRLANFRLDPQLTIKEVDDYSRGSIATYLSDFDRRIPVRVRPLLTKGDDKLNSLLNYQIKKGIPLSEIVHVESTFGYNEIYHDQQNRALLITANAGGRNILAMVDELKTAAAALSLPAGYEIKIGGKIDEIREGTRSLSIILLLSLFLVYMILASEYESVLYPFIILLTSPLSVVGAFIAMFFAGQSYNVMSIVGLVIMLGAIDNDTVIALDLIIDNRRQGMGLHPAIVDGMKKRLRPIIMTTLTTILGVIPMIIGFGTGLELAVALSYPVIGGILASTLVAMYLDPVLYSYFDRFRRRD
jgi:hydrophobic/amphiphilic exporter-1 (mainly G- bacteria), HAE1 family